MSKPAGAGAHWPWGNDWAICQLLGSARGQCDGEGSMVFLCPDLHCPHPKARGSHLGGSCLLRACYTQLGREEESFLQFLHPRTRRSQGRKLDFSRSHLLLPGRWKPLSSQILGEPVTQQVNGIKRNWEDNLKRTFQETLSLDSGIWLHTNWWTKRPCFSQMQRFHPNDDIEVNLIISQRHDWMCDLKIKISVML